VLESFVIWVILLELVRVGVQSESEEFLDKVLGIGSIIDIQKNFAESKGQKGIKPVCRELWCMAVKLGH